MTLEEEIKKQQQIEMAIFWDLVSLFLPKSKERHALGDNKIFEAIYRAYIEFRPILLRSVFKRQAEGIIGEIEELPVRDPTGEPLLNKNKLLYDLRSKFLKTEK